MVAPMRSATTPTSRVNDGARSVDEMIPDPLLGMPLTLPEDAPEAQRGLWVRLRQMPGKYLAEVRNVNQDGLLSDKGRAMAREDAAKPFAAEVARITARIASDEADLTGAMFAAARSAGVVQGDAAFIARHQVLFELVLGMGDIDRMKLAQRAATAHDREVLLALHHVPVHFGAGERGHNAGVAERWRTITREALLAIADPVQAARLPEAQRTLSQLKTLLAMVQQFFRGKIAGSVDGDPLSADTAMAPTLG